MGIIFYEKPQLPFAHIVTCVKHMVSVPLIQIFFSFYTHSVRDKVEPYICQGHTGTKFVEYKFV